MGSVLIACIGAGISLFGAFQYFRSILKGDTRPRLASWTAWGVANAVFAVVAFLQGSNLAAVLNGIAALVNLAIICASVIRKQGEKPTGTSDWSCLIAALCCLGVLAVFPDNKTLGAFMAMAANRLSVCTCKACRHKHRNKSIHYRRSSKRIHRRI